MKIGEEGSKNKQGFFAMDGLVVDLLDRVQELADNGAEDVTGVRTGFIDMDKMTAGLQRATSSSWPPGLRWVKPPCAEHWRKRGRERRPAVAVFSMEMGASQLAAADGGLHRSHQPAEPAQAA